MIWINEKLRKMREEKGFTLIELMVVVLIIAILIAIAIPTFLGARERAQNRAAQSSVRNAVTAGKVIFTDHEDYTEATTDGTDADALIDVQSAEPSLQMDPADQQLAAGDLNTKVSVFAANANTFVAVARATNGTCFAMKDVTTSGGGTTYAKGTSVAACKASTVPAASFGPVDTNW